MEEIMFGFNNVAENYPKMTAGFLTCVALCGSAGSPDTAQANPISMEMLNAANHYQVSAPEKLDINIDNLETATKTPNLNLTTEDMTALKENEQAVRENEQVARKAVIEKEQNKEWKAWHEEDKDFAEGASEREIEEDADNISPETLPQFRNILEPHFPENDSTASEKEEQIEKLGDSFGSLPLNKIIGFKSEISNAVNFHFENYEAIEAPPTLGKVGDIVSISSDGIALSNEGDDLTETLALGTDEAALKLATTKAVDMNLGNVNFTDVKADANVSCNYQGDCQAKAGITGRF